MIQYGNGVYLQPLNPDNSEIYREARNNFSTWRWCRQNDLISPLQQKRWLEAQDQDRTIMMYEICDAEIQYDAGFTGEVVGVCGFTDIDFFNQRAEFSLYTMPGKRGKGYATKGLETLIEHGFKNLNLNMIWGETMDGNPAANIFERIGMMNTGFRPDFYFKDGEFWDAHFYCIRREDWITLQ